ATTTAVVSGTAALLPDEALGSGTPSDGMPFTGDSVSLTGTPTATYNSKDVSAATTVTFAGLSLTGSSASNYSLTPLTQSATITQKAVSYFGISISSTKVYDATTAAAFTG